MKLVTVDVIGTRPLLINAFKVEVISNLKKVKSGSAGNNPEEWKSTVLEKNNQIYIFGEYWRACLKEGAKYTKAGRATVQKSFTSCMVVETLFSLVDRYLPEGWQEMSIEQMPTDSSLPLYIDIRGVMNPNSKGRNVRYRVACSIGWKTSFKFSFDDTIVSAPQIRKIVEDSGKLIGVGDGRGLGYGRFSIGDLKIENREE